MSFVQRHFDFAGRSALVTGAAGHLGREICRALAEQGCHVWAADRPGGDLAALCSELKAYSIEPLEFDLADRASPVAMADRVAGRNGALDILVHNAAFVGTSQLEGWAVPFGEQKAEVWPEVLDLNLTSVFALTQACAGLLRASRHGSVLAIASIYGVAGPDWALYEGTALANPAAYAASKGGLVQLTRWMATTLAPEIRVNSISPGGIFRNQPKAFVEKYQQRTPLRRMASEEDVVGGVLYLTSDLSRYVTGHNLLIDGGWTAW